jgi:hypothetical protein
MRYVRSLSLAVTILAIGAVASSAAAQSSYPMACRGGGNIISYLAISQMQPGQAATFNAYTSFAKGTGPAYLGLSPGTCTWMDRGLRSGEPSTLMQTGGALLSFSQMWPASADVTGAGAGLGLNPNPVPYIPLNHPTSDMSGTLQNPNWYFTFDVYNGGQGYFIITRIRCSGTSICS